MGVLHHGKVVEVTADGVMVTVPLLANDDSQFGPCTVFGPEVFVGDSVLVGQIEGNAEDLVVVSGVNASTLDFVDSTTIDFTKTVVGPDTDVTAIVKPNSIPLNDLSDVAVSSPAAGQVIRHNGSNWVNSGLSADDLSDVTLSSLATNQFLQYNGSIWVNVSNLEVSGYVRSTRGSASNGLFAGRVTSDPDDRLLILADGKIQWGDGTNPQDTNLYRPAANVLKTDDTLQVAGTLAALNNATVGGTLAVTSTATVNGDAVTLRKKTYSALSGTGTRTATSYADLPGSPTITFVKAHGSGVSNLVVDAKITAWLSGSVGTILGLAVLVNSTDNVLCQFYFNTAGEHTSIGGLVSIPSLAAGSYNCVLRWRVVSGSGTLNQDNPNDWNAFSVEEVPV